MNNVVVVVKSKWMLPYSRHRVKLCALSQLSQLYEQVSIFTDEETGSEIK